MAAKFFGQFLLEKGLISSQQLLHALDAQRASNPMLGELAEAAGMLTASQTERINQRQRAEDRRFGDLAQEMGLLRADQVDSLLSMQKARRRYFGEILVDAGILVPEVLERELELHRQEREQVVQALEADLSSHPLGSVASAATDACSKLFPRLFRASCRYSGLLRHPAELEPHPVAGAIHVTGGGERDFSVVIACDFSTMTRIAGAFLGLHAIACDEDLARDALGEFLNVVMGYVAKEAMPADARYRASPPDFTHTAPSFMRQGERSLGVSMASELGPFALLVAE